LDPALAFNFTIADLLQWDALIVAALFLIIGSISDLKRREVSDKVWLVFGPLGLALTVIRLVNNASFWYLTAVSIAATSAIALVLAFAGLYGGADAKALICLALTVPLVPDNILPLLGHLHPILPLTVLYNAYLFALVPVTAILIRNVAELLTSRSEFFDRQKGESGTRKLLLMLTGYRVRLGALSRSIHLFPLEEFVEGDGVRLRLFVPAESDRESQIANLERGLPRDSMVWATPGLPLLVFITIGYIFVLGVGDILMWALLTALGLP
jgi:preflagellin peptidase FlaK